MSEKLVPKNPEEVMVIRDVSALVTTLSVPFLRFGMVKIGGRATIGLSLYLRLLCKSNANKTTVKMASGKLAVFSPVALTETVKTKISTLSPTNTVSYLIAPDMEHHIFLSSWHAAFPSAHIIGPEGLPEKRAKQTAHDKSVTEVPFGTIFTAKNKEQVKVGGEFDTEFEYEFVDAHPNKELVFFHKPSKTLIEADLMFNLPATEQYSKAGESSNTGIFTKIFGALQNTKGAATWQKRMLWYALSAGNREGFNSSIAKIAAWDFDTIVPCHGDTMIGDGKGIFQKVFEWHLLGKGKKTT